MIVWTIFQVDSPGTVLIITLLDILALDILGLDILGRFPLAYTVSCLQKIFTSNIFRFAIAISVVLKIIGWYELYSNAHIVNNSEAIK